jgi:hypothetical protein
LKPDIEGNRKLKTKCPISKKKIKKDENKIQDYIKTKLNSKKIILKTFCFT